MSGDPINTITIYRSQAYVAGVLHGDGWCTPLSLGLRCKDADFSKTFARESTRVTSEPVIPKRDERGYWLIRKSNKTGRFNRLPDFIPSDNDQKSSWLRGLFDSDGSAQCLKLPRGTASYQRRIAIYSADRPKLFIAMGYLQDLGMDAGIRETKNSASHKGTKIIFELRLLRREAMTAFSKIVGSSIERKQITLDRIASTFQPPGWEAHNWRRAMISRYPHLVHGQ